MDSGDGAGGIGCGGDQRWPSAAGRCQPGQPRHHGNSSADGTARNVRSRKSVIPRARRYASAIVPRIGSDMANKRRARFGRSPWCGRDRLVGLRSRQAQKPSRLVECVSQRRAALRLSNKIEEVAVFAGGRVCPLARRTPVGALQPDHHRAAGRVVDVAHCPPATLATTVGEVVAAGPPRHSRRDGGPGPMRCSASRKAPERKKGPPSPASPQGGHGCEVTRRPSRGGRTRLPQPRSPLPRR